jgi:Tol biopolymer transport system component
LAKGAVVEVRASAGFPQLAFDDGRRIFLARGQDGSHRRALQLPGGREQTQPAWTPDGRRLVYRDGSADEGRLWITDAARGTLAPPVGGRPLTPPGNDDRRPAVSPNGQVVAFVRGARPETAHRLCFVAISATAVASCLPDVGVGVSRPVWSPDGAAILARTDTGRLMQFETTSRSSPSVASWSSRGTLPLDQLGRIQSVAWSVHGSLAIAVTAVQGQPALYRAHGLDLSTLESVKFDGAACELSWRSDGRELVVATRVGDDGALCPGVPGADPGSATRITPGGPVIPVGGRVVDPAYRDLPLGG